MAQIKQDGDDVLYSNAAFVEEEKLKNSFKAAVKDAGYDMRWRNEEKAYRITDAKLKDITKLNVEHQKNEEKETIEVDLKDWNDMLENLNKLNAKINNSKMKMS